MTDEELIAGLRANALWVTTHDAADRIETLKADLKSVLDRESATYARHDAKVERLEAALIQMRDDRTAFRHAVHFRRFITAALKGADHE